MKITKETLIQLIKEATAAELAYRDAVRRDRKKYLQKGPDLEDVASLYNPLEIGSQRQRAAIKSGANTFPGQGPLHQAGDTETPPVKDPRPQRVTSTAPKDPNHVRKFINDLHASGRISRETKIAARRALYGKGGKYNPEMGVEAALAILRDAGVRMELKESKITKEALKQIVMEELRTTLTEQATNPVGMPVEPDIQSMAARDAEIAKVQRRRAAARAERDAAATEKAAAAQELEKKKAGDKSMEQAALSAMAKLGAEKALAIAEKALNNLSIIIEGATEGDNDSEQLGQDLLRRAQSPGLSTRSGNVIDVKKYTRVGSNTSKSVTELAKVLDQARNMFADAKNKLRAAKRVSSGMAPPR